MDKPSEQELIAALKRIAHATDNGRASGRLAPAIAAILINRGLIIPSGPAGYTLTVKARELLRGIS